MRNGSNRTGANVYDNQDQPEQQYERSESPAPVIAYMVLTTLIAVVCFIAAMAAWTSA
jgi:hypothetical protein